MFKVEKAYIECSEGVEYLRLWYFNTDDYIIKEWDERLGVTPQKYGVNSMLGKLKPIKEVMNQLTKCGVLIETIHFVECVNCKERYPILNGKPSCNGKALTKCLYCFE